MLEWQGRNLINFANTNGEIYNYSYNADGIRTKKYVYDADSSLAGSTEYIYDGTKLIAESRNGTWLYYLYDASGAVTGMSYNGTLYYFRKNLQGDVTGIYNASGNIIAQYEYTPYGALLAVTDADGNDISANATHIANINPFRYRGYYYDTETGFYYLQSRYYDPVVGRFINADVIIGANGGIEGYNSFAYCNNNPVMKYDPTGYDAIIIHETDSANTAGHTGLIVQAENGQWYYFYWGPKNENDYIGMTTVGVKKKCVMLPLELGDIKTIDDIKTAMSNSDYAFIRDRADLTTHHVYLEGDYTNTFEYLRELRISKTKYHLINFNCAIVTYKALDTSNPFFRFLSPTSHVFNIVPDMSFGKVKTFDTVNRAFDAGLEYLKTKIDVVCDGVKSFWKKLFY